MPTQSTSRKTPLTAQEFTNRAIENFKNNFLSAGGLINTGLGLHIALTAALLPAGRYYQMLGAIKSGTVAPMGSVLFPENNNYGSMVGAATQFAVGLGFGVGLTTAAGSTAILSGIAAGTVTSMVAAAIVQTAYEIYREQNPNAGLPATPTDSTIIPPDFFSSGAYRAVVEAEMSYIWSGGYPDPTLLYPHCFLPGTPILMADGTHKPIEQIRIGDLVMAFDLASQEGRGALTPSRVTRTFQNTTRTVVDLRGLRMTPGHVCLTGEGGFATIAAILAADGTLVLADGTPIRARTGARLASAEDALVRVTYADPATGAPRQVTLRAGIPCAADGLTLAAVLAESGYTTLADGSLRAPNGEMFDCADWPGGTTPLDTADQQNWIVLGPEGQPYTPAWMQGLEEEAGMEQAVGATTRTLTAGPAARPAFRPHLVGGTLSGLPAIGTAIGRMH